jgi:hypothetical protein
MRLKTIMTKLSKGLLFIVAMIFYGIHFAFTCAANPHIAIAIFGAESLVFFIMLTFPKKL